jgi:hypothetical protein
MYRSVCLSLVGLLLLPAASPAERAQRMSELALRDPHVWVFIDFFGCRDVTDTAPLGLGDAFNESIEKALTLDGDEDGYLDLNPLLYFPPPEGATGFVTMPTEITWDPELEEGELVFHFGTCTTPLESPICDPDPVNPIQWLGYVTSDTSVCLDIIPGTTFGYDPPVSVPNEPCFVTEPFSFLLELNGVMLQMEYGQLGATFSGGGTEPVSLVNGLVRGWLRESCADTTILPPNIPIMGGQPVSALFPGGTGCCAEWDERDVEPGGTDLGWWFYFNFATAAVEFTPATGAPMVAGAGGAQVELGPGFPNPSRGTVRLEYALPAASAVDLSVVDVSGRRLVTLLRSLRPAGRHSAIWNGNDATGRPAVGGVYFVRLETSLGDRTRKIVMSR